MMFRRKKGGGGAGGTAAGAGTAGAGGADRASAGPGDGGMEVTDAASWMLARMDAAGPAANAVASAANAAFARLQPWLGTILLDGKSESRVDPVTVAAVDVALGLMLLFLSREYILCIAAAEAFRLGGWNTNMKAALGLLYADYLRVSAALERDNTVDEDRDGVADVRQIPARELAVRRLRLIMLTLDPVKTQNAMVRTRGAQPAPRRPHATPPPRR